jgi:hypothetical protein
MNTFKRKALSCAVLAGLGAVAGTAEAVYRNPDNTGQVLIYPYYTVNTIRGNAYNTYISITNTTSSVKVLKVRFREGRTSAEVLDFNLYLSPNDMWVAPIGPASAGATVPPSLFPAVSAPGGDTSCTNPPIPAAGQPFSNVAYSSNIPAPGGDDLPGTGLERTREGYVEVFEMGTLTGAAATAVTHVTGGAPPNCALGVGGAVAGALAPIGAPTGGLYGQAGIINVTNGSIFSYVADALDAYSTTPYYAEVTTNAPVLGLSANPQTSLVFANNSTLFDTWGGGASGLTASEQTVAAVFMHSSVMNNYILDTATASNTDWVLTFPIKREFTGPGVAANTVRDPFTANLTSAGACEPAQFNFFNRDEQSFIPANNLFSPPANNVGGAGTGNLCWESTVLSIRNGVAHTSAADVSATDPRSGVLGSRNVLVVPVLGTFQNGWMSLTFTGARSGQTAIPSGGSGTGGVASATGGGLVSTAASARFTATGATVGGLHTFAGLPVTGFMVTAALNSAIPNCQITATTTGNCAGNYGQLFAHAYRTLVTP